MRLAGIPRENQFSLIHKPWFEFSIVYDFKPYDFFPSTRVKASMFRFVQRQIPLIPDSQKVQYQEFIRIGFGEGLPIIQNLSKKYGQKKIRRILKALKINNYSKPAELTIEEWVKLYNELSFRFH